VKRLLAIIAVLIHVVGPDRPASVCADDRSGAEAIVVEPSSDGAPTVVRLNAGGDDAKDDDPLKIGEFTLIDQDGEEFNSAELEGHPWVAAFIFTRCAGYCPMLVRSLRLELADRVDDPDLRFVVVSVDPEYDTPEQLRKYAEIWVDSFDRWVFLTGDKSEIFKLVQHGFRLPLQEMQGKDRLPGFEVAHSLSLIHVGPDGRVIGKYDSRDEQQVLTLRRVLNGQMETPEANRVPSADAAGEELTIEGPAGEAAAGQPGAAADGQPRGLDALPDWAARLPSTNAMLNGLATLLLLAGFIAIRRGHIEVHKRLMMFAFATSVAFLASYLTYHFALSHYTGTHGKPFEGTGGVRTLYYAILVSHVLLATAVPVLALVTIYRGLREQWDAHRRIARITFPIWLYVSVTGVIIYGMLYHWPA
jgi:protein SCO1